MLLCTALFYFCFVCAFIPSIILLGKLFFVRKPWYQSVSNVAPSNDDTMYCFCIGIFFVRTFLYEAADFDRKFIFTNNVMLSRVASSNSLPINLFPFLNLLSCRLLMFALFSRKKICFNIFLKKYITF